MPDWLTSIGITAAGMPWWATIALLLLAAISRELIPKLLLWKNANLQERQYDDGQVKAGYEALVAELKSRVEKLEGLVEKTNNKLDASQAAHANCQVEQEKLRGEMNVMKVEIERLKNHDEANLQNKAVLRDALKKVDPNAAADIA